MPDPAEDPELASPRRAIWSGTITFGLVSIPVDVYAAVRARQTAMKLVDRKGHPLGRQYYCPQDGKVLANDDIVRGYETDAGKMVVVTDEELASVAPELSRDIDLARFVPLEEIPPTYYQRPYILVPSGRSSKAYHLLAETMARTARVGIGTFVMRGNQYLVAILSEGGLLRAQTLRFADEIRSPADVGLPKPGKAPAKLVKVFTAAIRELTRDALDMDELSDRYAAKIHELAAEKEAQGKDVVATDTSAAESDEAEGAEVIDLVKLLRERLSAKAKVAPVEALPEAKARSKAAPARAPSRGKGKAGDALERMSKEELYERAQALDIPGRSRMGKAELVAAIRAAA